MRINLPFERECHQWDAEAVVRVTYIIVPDFRRRTCMHIPCWLYWDWGFCITVRRFIVSLELVLCWWCVLCFVQLSQRRVRLHVNWVNAEYTNIYKDFIIPRWLSWRGVSLHIDSVDVESHLALTQLTRNETPRQLSQRQMLKNSNKSAISRTNSKKTSKALLFRLYVFDNGKKREQKNLVLLYL